MNWQYWPDSIVDWGHTGSTGSGLADTFSRLTPTIYFGKGFGDLPDSFSWIRAFAVTGQVGYQIPTNSFDFTQNVFIPQQLVYGASLQYSMPYLKSEVIDLQLPDFFNHLIPIVEVSLTTPVANNFGNPYTTTGTVNPGVIWVGSYFQVGPGGHDTRSTAKAAAGSAFSASCICISTTCSRRPLDNHCSGEPRPLPAN